MSLSTKPADCHKVVVTEKEKYCQVIHSVKIHIHLENHLVTSQELHLYRKWSIPDSVSRLHNLGARKLSGVRLFVTPWTVPHQAPLSMGFSWQEYWCRLPFPPPGDRPHPGNEPTSPLPPALAGGFFTTAPPGKSVIQSTPLCLCASFSSPVTYMGCCRSLLPPAAVASPENLLEMQNLRPHSYGTRISFNKIPR